MLRPVRINLRLKLSAALVAVAVLTAASAGFFATRSSYEALKHQKQQDELVMAKNIAAQVDEVLRKARQTVEALAEDPQIKSMEPDRQKAALTLVAKVTELIDGIVVSDLSGRVLVADQTEPNTASLLPEQPYQFMIEPVKRQASARFSEIFKSRSGEVVVAINAPIYRGRALVGVLSGLILLKNHSMGGIEGIRIGKSGYAYLVDSDGNVIVHPQRQKLLENLRAHPPVQELLKNRLGVIEFVNQEGVSVLAAFAPIEPTGWGVVVRQPTSESYAYAQQILYFLCAVFLAGMGLAAFVGVMLARKIAEPVTLLAEGVRKVTRGDLEARIPVAGRDEIGELAEAFNEMTRRLRLHLEEIQTAHKRVLSTQQQLFQSEKLAAIGQLAAGLAHEINNPLNIISGFNEVLLDETPSNDVRRPRLEEIGRETARCQRLVAELLHFAKPKEPDRRPTDVGALVTDTLHLVQSQAKAQGVEIEAETSGNLSRLRIDADQIKQAVLNLLLNACQAMPEGGRLNVRTRRANGHVEIRVSDTGPGVPEKNIKSIFNPFFTTKDEGTGLGLPLSHAIVEQHGGKIGVESAPGRGSVFTISLPAGELA